MRRDPDSLYSRRPDEDAKYGITLQSLCRISGCASRGGSRPEPTRPSTGYVAVGDRRDRAVILVDDRAAMRGANYPTCTDLRASAARVLGGLVEDERSGWHQRAGDGQHLAASRQLPAACEDRSAGEGVASRGRTSVAAPIRPDRRITRFRTVNLKDARPSGTYAMPWRAKRTVGAGHRGAAHPN